MSTKKKYDMLRTKYDTILGQALKAIRYEYDESQDCFAERVGLERAHYGKVELGKVGIRVLTFMRLTKRIGIAPDIFIGRIFPRYFQGKQLSRFNPTKIERSGNFLNDLGSNLKELRKSQFMGLKSVAFKTEISSTYCSKIERGIPDFSLSILIGIADALEVAPDYIISTVLQENRIHINPVPIRPNLAITRNIIHTP